MYFFQELKRRNVFRVALAYLVISWLVMQVGDTMGPALHLPEWVNSMLAFFLILGFPIAIFFAWAFELTPEGLKREQDIDRQNTKPARKKTPTLHQLSYKSRSGKAVGVFSCYFKVDFTRTDVRL